MEKQIEEMRKDLVEIFDEEYEKRRIITADFTAIKMQAKGWCKQSEGENIGTLHPADEFICSKCGVVLEGWTKVVTDEDDGEEYHYEYIFKFCPECGMKIS